MNPSSNGQHTPPAIIVAEGLSKQYHIGVKEKRHDTFMQSATAWLTSPLTNLRQLRRQAQISDADAVDVIWPLRDVTFTVHEGEVVGLIGRNGAGKSTLLKILSRITPPTHGRVVLNGRVSSLLEVGTGFHPELTGRENVYLNGTILGMRKAEVDRQFDEIVAFAEVEKFIDTPVKRYSSGMRVRLAFAVSAHLQAEILLVDEVLAVGDAAFQEKCLNKMDGVARVGRTVLLVSHNMQVIQRLCSRTILLEQGRLVAQGAPNKVIETYLAQYFSNPLPEPLTFGDTICLRELRVVQDGYDIGEFVDNRRPVQVHLRYEVVQPIRSLLMGFDVFAGDGTRLYRTYDMEAAGMDERQPGAYCSTWELPANAFLPGNFYLELMLGVHRHGWFSRGDIRLKLNFNGALDTDVTYFGIIGPQGKWRLVREGNAALPDLVQQEPSAK